jgi:hypothetical protein
MPITWIVIGVLALGSVVAWTLLRIRINALERRLEESARAEAEAETRIMELLGHRVEKRAVNGGPEKRRRHLWLVPALAALATAAGWLRQHPHQVIAGAAAGVSAVALGLLVVSGAGGSSRAEPPEPAPIITAPRTPSSVTPLPPSVSSPARQPSSTPGGGTPIGSVAATQGMLPPPTTVPTATRTATSRPPLPTSTTLVPPVPTTTTAGCLLDVSLDPLLGLCVG